MLLTSPGDHGSSLPIDSLQPLPPDCALKGQIIAEGDQVTVTSSLEAMVEEYHASPQLKDELTSSSLRSHADVSTASRDAQMKEATKSGTLPALRQTVWAQSLSQDRDLDGLYALRHAATLKALHPSGTRSWSRQSLATLADVSAGEATDLCSFAAPLSPLRERDLTALSEFFLRDDMHAIEADLSQRLLSLLPEPCWEDNVFDFLKEFL